MSSVHDVEKGKFREDDELEDDNEKVEESTVETAAAEDENGSGGNVPEDVKAAEDNAGLEPSDPNVHIRDGRDTRFLVGWEGPDDPKNPQVCTQRYPT